MWEDPLWLRKLVLSWSSLEFSPGCAAWLLCREHGQATLPLLLLEPFPHFAHWLRTASWHASACLHHTDFDFSTTIREPGINEKKDFESLKELACKPELMWWSRVVLCAAAAPQFPSMPPSLFKDGISVLHCILQHQHTHCLLLFESSCAQGNRSFININSLVSEHFVDLESIVSFSVASPQATDSSNVYQKK